jgi:hypothetical protein
MPSIGAVHKTSLLFVLGVAFVSAGCAPLPAPFAPESPLPAAAPTFEVVQDDGIQQEETMSAEVNENPIVAAAIKDLSKRLGVEASEIEVVSFEAVTWPDGGLGCPQPGMMYTQSMVDGSRTVLRVDGVEYTYHSGGSRGPFLCENPQ